MNIRQLNNGVRLYSHMNLVVQRFVVRTQHVIRLPGKRFDEKYKISSNKQPPCQTTFSAMCNSSTAGLYFLINGATMNGEN